MNVIKYKVITMDNNTKKKIFIEIYDGWGYYEEETSNELFPDDTGGLF